MSDNKAYDVVIIGGSYAGLAAGMALGRSIRKVLIIDSGQPCNAQTPHSHNFITHDGSAPAEIAAQAKAQVLQYPTVRFLEDLAIAVSGTDPLFRVETAQNGVFTAKKLLFATGIKDLLPGIPGLASCWGISVIHCPYCHGYEYRGQRTGILINGNQASEFSMLLRNWTDKLSIFTNGPSEIPEQERMDILKRGITIDERIVAEVVHEEGMIKEIGFSDGSAQELDALYAKIPFIQHCPIPEALGCKLTIAGFIEVDECKRTSVHGVFAAGDNSWGMRSVSSSVGAGNLAGAFINHELIRQASSGKS